MCEVDHEFTDKEGVAADRTEPNIEGKGGTVHKDRLTERSSDYVEEFKKYDVPLKCR